MAVGWTMLVKSISFNRLGSTVLILKSYHPVLLIAYKAYKDNQC